MVCYAVPLVVGLIAFAASAATVIAANVSYPATYSGSAASGGTVSFDVSADGTAVTRFAVANVPTSCGTVTATTTGSFPIVNDAFQSTSSSGLRFSGSFPAVQQASGTLSFRLSFPSCTSQDVAWTATTPTPPPTPKPPPDPTAPQTTISSGPSGKTSSRQAKFRFRSSEAGSTFLCKLDAKPWRGCRSPAKYYGLATGRHTSKVKARDGVGNTDSSPAKRSWRVDAG